MSQDIILIVSMTDGVVQSKGWLPKGGYRIGILAPSGGYFYYAHLDSYADIKEGDRVKAGDVIGFMGDTGYGVGRYKREISGASACGNLCVSERSGDECQSILGDAVSGTA